MARAQHAAYACALAASGWMIRQVPAADDCPDSVFIEDTVVICEDLAVLTRPGAPGRRAEVAGVAQAVRSLGLRTACIEEPGVLDGAMCCRPATRSMRDAADMTAPYQCGRRPTAITANAYFW